MQNQEKISGIYKIVNKVNGKYYVGSAVNLTGNSRSRHHTHFRELRQKEHQNSHLQAAWNKYGAENFEFIVIEQNIPRDQLYTVEQKYLNIAKNEQEKCYNMSFIAHGGVEMTEEVIEKIRKAKKGKKYPKYSEVQRRIWAERKKNGICFAAHKGQKMSQEAKEKIRKANTGRIKTSETREKLSKANLGKKWLNRQGENHLDFDHTVYCFYHIQNSITFVGTRHALYKKYNVKSGSFCRCLKGEQKASKGWIIIKKENLN